MSLWQRKNIHKRHLLLLKLYGVCFFFHCAFLGWLFFINNNDLYHVSLSLHTQIDYSAPILFIPINTPTTYTTAASKDTAVASKESTARKTTVVKSATTLTKTNATETKQIAHSIVQPKEESKTEPIKEVVKKPTPQTVQPEQIVEQKKISPNPVGSPTQKPLVVQENAHISHNYREAEILKRTAQLQKELINNWKPPIGIPPQTSCEITFVVDQKGNICKNSMTKSSGILMYDISARQALFSMKMPQWTYNKTITITFT